MTAIDSILNGDHFCIMPGGLVKCDGLTLGHIRDFERDILFFICDWPDESRAAFENRYSDQVYDLRRFEQATLKAKHYTTLTSSENMV